MNDLASLRRVLFCSRLLNVAHCSCVVKIHLLQRGCGLCMGRVCLERCQDSYLKIGVPSSAYLVFYSLYFAAHLFVLPFPQNVLV